MDGVRKFSRDYIIRVYQSRYAYLKANPSFITTTMPDPKHQARPQPTQPTQSRPSSSRPQPPATVRQPARDGREQSRPPLRETQPRPREREAGIKQRKFEEFAEKARDENNSENRYVILEIF